MDKVPKAPSSFTPTATGSSLRENVDLSVRPKQFHGQRKRNVTPQSTAIETGNRLKIHNLFEQKKPLEGRNVTASEVFNAYKTHDTTSVRSALFLESCFFKKQTLEGSEEIKPEMILAEFDRRPDRGNKRLCELGKINFYAECFLNNTLVSNKPVSPQFVINAFDEMGKHIEKGYFLQRCFYKNLTIKGEVIKPESVLKEYNIASPNSSCSSTRFKEYCCLNNISITGRFISPNTVLHEYASLNLFHEQARFLSECFFYKLPVSGALVDPAFVVSSFEDLNLHLDLAIFLERCLFSNIKIDDLLIAAESVYLIYKNCNARKELGFFMQKCFEEDVPLYGRKITAQEVLKNQEGIAAALFSANLFFNNSSELNDMTAEYVISLYPTDKQGSLGVLRFKMNCFFSSYKINNKRLKAHELLAELKNEGFYLEAAYFLSGCFKSRINIKNHIITPEEVISSFPDTKKGNIGATHFKEFCMLSNIQIFDKKLTSDEIYLQFTALNLELAALKFLQTCFERYLYIENKPISAEQLYTDFERFDAHLEIAFLKTHLFFEEIPIFGKKITIDEANQSFPNNKQGHLGSARFQALCFMKGYYVNNPTVTIDSCENKFLQLGATLEARRFVADCFVHGFKSIPPERAESGFPSNRHGQIALARLKADCCIFKEPLTDGLVSPESVMMLYSKHGAHLESVRFKSDLYFKRRMFKGSLITPESIIGSYSSIRSTRLETVRFKAECCLRGISINNKFTSPVSIIDDLRSLNKDTSASMFQAHLSLLAISVNNEFLTDPEIIKSFIEQKNGQNKSKGTVLSLKYASKRLFQLSTQVNTELEIWKLMDLVEKLMREVDYLSDDIYYNFSIFRFISLVLNVNRNTSFDFSSLYNDICSITPTFYIIRFKILLLTECYLGRHQINDKNVEIEEVLKVVKTLPKGYYLRDSLLKQLKSITRSNCSEYNIILRLLSNPKGKSIDVVSVYHTSNDFRIMFDTTSSNITSEKSNLDANVSCEEALYIDARSDFYIPLPSSFFLSIQIIDLIKEIQLINKLYTTNVIIVTGSFSRTLQNLSKEYCDIDLMTTAEGATLLSQRLNDKYNQENSNQDELPLYYLANKIPGCPHTKLPSIINMRLNCIGSGTKPLTIQANIYETPLSDLDTITVYDDDNDLSLPCLTFEAEIKLIIGSMNYLSTNLLNLTTDIMSGQITSIPRSLIFSYQTKSIHTMNALFIRCGLTINKSLTFLNLLKEGQKSVSCSEIQRKTLTSELESELTLLLTLLKSHESYPHFLLDINQWLEASKPTNTYEDKRKKCVQNILELFS